MERNPLPHGKIIYVCLNERETGTCCAARNSPEIHLLLKEAIRVRGLNTQIRVSRSGCMGRCGNGPNVLVFPDGVWYSGVSSNDVETILQEITGDGV